MVQSKTGATFEAQTVTQEGTVVVVVPVMVVLVQMVQIQYLAH